MNRARLGPWTDSLVLCSHTVHQPWDEAQRILEQEGAWGPHHTAQHGHFTHVTLRVANVRRHMYDFKIIFLCPRMASLTFSWLFPQALQTTTRLELNSVFSLSLLSPCSTVFEPGVSGPQLEEEALAAGLGLPPVLSSPRTQLYLELLKP